MVPFYSGNKILCSGDSITAQGYPTVSGGFQDLLTAKLTPYTASYTATAGGVAAKSANGAVSAIAGPPVTVPRGTFPTGSISIINTGIPGQTSGQLAADVANQITSHNPDVVVVLIGINDISSPTPDPVAYGVNVQSIVTQVRAWSSTVPIGLVSPLTFGDSWTAGPPVAFLSEGGDSTVLAFCAQLQTIAANNTGVTYIPARDGMLAWEVTNNAPAPGVEGTLFNERHPTIPLGQVQLGTAMVPYFQASP